MACQIEQDFQALEVLHAITLPCKSLLGTTTSGFKWIPSGTTMHSGIFLDADN